MSGIQYVKNFVLDGQKADVAVLRTLSVKNNLTLFDIIDAVLYIFI